MKHIFKKLHFGSSSSHDSPSGRSNEATPSPSPSSSALAPTLSCESDHRQATSPAAVPPITSPSPTSPIDGTTAMTHSSAERVDYFSSEEEFQMQLALAISASNSEFREDPHNDQIRAATLLSLGNHRVNPEREEESTAESLSRRYWDYNVLDYDEKVVDGFYDIFVLSANSSGHGKMPSLVDLQTAIGDLNFEVIVVNRVIDRSLLELEQVADCISDDCRASETGILVQRIADLITEHMGGPVRDANDMLAHWMDRSSTLRRSLQTNLMPIGGVTIGLSRHRALLFKVLADKIGIPCKLVKGSHYTGIEDDAVNIIKLESEREFLVDLMAAPGALIPADVLSAKDTSLASCNPRLNRDHPSWVSNNFGSSVTGIESTSEEESDNVNYALDSISIMETKLPSENANLGACFPSSSAGPLPSSSGTCADGASFSLFPNALLGQSQLANPAASGYKESLQLPAISDNLKERANPVTHLQENMDPHNLFAELNPFQTIGVRQVPLQFNSSDKKMNDYQGLKDITPTGPGRPPLPLVWKNRSACNENPNNRRNDNTEGMFPRINKEQKGHNALTPSFPCSSSSTGKRYPETSKNNIAQMSNIMYSGGMITNNEMDAPHFGSFIGFPAATVETNLASGFSQTSASVSDDGNGRARHPTTLLSSEPKLQETHKSVLPSYIVHEEVHVNVSDKPDRRKHIHDKYLGIDVLMKDPGSSGALTQPRTDRLDPMLDDVAEWEIPWEDLVIGERIGLGSYGEVYHADWNGTEVAVKKFLDQDFYGDALDEFRSEVRIMRRLRHPNVVLFMGAVTRPPNLSIVTEFLPRGSLYRIVHRPNCQIDQKRRIKMALDVAKGMNCLHTSTPTIVHRDLKSPNLLVDKNWNVKVCDFGLSRLKHNTFLSSKSTAGTPEWMAPEVLRNEQSNEKCDVYSYGVILWELATLKMPWSGMNPMQVVGAVGFQNRRLDIPKEVDPLVARIIWECWQTDPNLRPSFAQLTSALKPLQQLVLPSYQDTESSSLLQEISVNSTP